MTMEKVVRRNQLIAQERLLDALEHLLEKLPARALAQ